MGIDFVNYFKRVRKRFSDAMINDSVLRIVSGTSDKFPKFVLPIAKAQMKLKYSQLKYIGLIAGAWWYYLSSEMNKNEMQDVNDLAKNTLKEIFSDNEMSIYNFIGHTAIFDNIKDEKKIIDVYIETIQNFQSGNIITFLKQIIDNK